MTPFSRRELLQSSGSALVCLFAQGISQAQHDIAAKALKISLVREFRKKRIKDISPDGSKLCFENWGEDNYPLEVVEIGTWKMVFSESFQARVLRAIFFSDSRTLIASTHTDLGNRNIVTHLTLVDLHAGKCAEDRHFAGTPYEDDYPEALSEKILLVPDINLYSIEKCFLALVEFPTCREIARAPLVVKPSEPEQSIPADARFGLSNDRSIFVYSYGQTLVCRRTSDLEILWTQKIKPPIEAKSITSPNKNYVAVAIADSAFREKQKESYISIYDGKTGADINRFSLCGTEGLALSPDGSLLAVVERKFDRSKKVYLLIVHILEVNSGTVLASFEHDRIKSQRSVATKAVCSVEFTSDGQYLISTGMNTKVWKLIRNEG